jgi:[protein-PII] uridylyltransferase
LKRSVAYIDSNFINNVEAGKQFVDIISGGKNVASTLRLMNEVGFIEHFIPEWKNIVCQMQYNMYHTYTTDEHTIRAISILSDLHNQKLKDKHPGASRIMRDMVSPSILYVAVLLHDIAKGMDGDHSVLGGDIARTVAPRLGFGVADTEMIAWLVEHHLVLFNMAQHRDVADLKTAQDLSTIVRGMRGLDMLSVLTIVDIRAVGRGAWSDWKGQLLRRLYHATRHVLSGVDSEKILEQQLDTVKEHLIPSLQHIENVEKLQSFIENVPNLYLLSTPLPNLVWQVQTVIQSDGYCVEIIPDDAYNQLEILVHNPDRVGLLTDLAYGLAQLNLDVVEAQIHTVPTFGALNVFRVHNPDNQTSQIDTIKSTLRDIIQNGQEPSLTDVKQKNFFDYKKENFTVKNNIVIDNNASDIATLVEVHTKNRHGVLYKISQGLLSLGLKITTAKIITYGEAVVDVFYVKDSYGFKLIQKDTQTVVKEKLNSILESLENSE